MSDVDAVSGADDADLVAGHEDQTAAAAAFVAQVTEYVLDFDKGHPHANILIAGKTGVGKSTLINTVFRGDMAETGIGRPVTQAIDEITKADVPLTIIDTKGLELADFTPIRTDILNYIEARKGEDAKTYVHVAWLCISDSSARIEDAELDLAKALKDAGLQVIVVLTKVSRFKDNPFEAVVREQFRDITSDIVLVRALSQNIYDDEDNVTSRQEVRGIDQLLNLSYIRLPEAQKYSFANSASISHKKAQEIKRNESETAINYFCTAAFAIGAAPIPFSDAALLAPLQAGMIIKISDVYGMDIGLNNVGQVMTSMVGVSGAISMVGKQIVTGAMKLVPGAGSLVGGTISGTTAAGLTKALGSQYASALSEINDKGKELTIDAAIAAVRKRIPF
ncbi:MAG: DUF697 domain-containing protein [Sphingomonadales bacterium]|nr:DUF697 domain-containing protein [Sphingomonadales bacterium]MDE2167799.1 DUF697 domain-containing protein [Sphingomonadales bacterium]